MIRVRNYLGERLLFDRLLDEGDEQDMAWLEFFRDETKRAYHPSIRLVITTYDYLGEETVIPENPDILEAL